MLTKLFRLIFGGCAHKYNIIEKCDLKDGYGSVGSRYYLQCYHCGKLKKKDFI